MKTKQELKRELAFHELRASEFFNSGAETERYRSKVIFSIILLAAAISEIIFAYIVGGNIWFKILSVILLPLCILTLHKTFRMSDEGYNIDKYYNRTMIKILKREIAENPVTE